MAIVFIHQDTMVGQKHVCTSAMRDSTSSESGEVKVWKDYVHFWELTHSLTHCYRAYNNIESPSTMHYTVSCIRPLCHPHLIMSPCPYFPACSCPIKSRSFLKFCTTDEILGSKRLVLNDFVCCDLLQYLPAHTLNILLQEFFNTLSWGW